jgi:hypothetical protein
VRQTTSSRPAALRLHASRPIDPATFLLRRSLAEQQEVEDYFQTLGVLLPTFHKQYWIGLTSSNQTWPTYNWT